MAEAVILFDRVLVVGEAVEAGVIRVGLPDLSI